MDKWLVQWRQRLAIEERSDSDRQAAMLATNPVYIPRNHQVEAVIRAAEDRHDFEPFHRLNDILRTPYEYQEGKESFMQPPLPEEVVKQTFCGT